MTVPDPWPLRWQWQQLQQRLQLQVKQQTALELTKAEWLLLGVAQLAMHLP